MAPPKLLTRTAQRYCSMQVLQNITQWQPGAAAAFLAAAGTSESMWQRMAGTSMLNGKDIPIARPLSPPVIARRLDGRLPPH